MTEASMSQTGSKQNRSKSGIRNITPSLPSWERRLLTSFVNSIDNDEDPSNSLREVARRWQDYPAMQKFCAISRVLADLANQGWRITADREQLHLIPSTHNPELGETVAEAKNRTRKSLLIGRNRQLEQPSVQAFIRKIEESKPNKKSVLELVTDGQELAEKIKASRQRDIGDDVSLNDVIDPVVEICGKNDVCTDTGIRLLDIWRYFRYTWSLEYRPVPGRAMPILIRNNAMKNRPIMGIAMLASPVMKMRARDQWLGLSMDQLERYAAENPRKRHVVLKRLKVILQNAIDDIRHDDLLSQAELEDPDQDVIFKLERLAAGAAAKRESELKNLKRDGEKASRGKVTTNNLGEVDWLEASNDPLFVKKRAETLAKLLQAKKVLAEILTGAQFIEALLEEKTRNAVQVALKEFLKTVMSSQAMDVSVCGAVAPYNDLLVGKLVALLTTSKEVAAAYKRRYGGQPSIIASQMAGRPIVKSTDLRILTTTSLYGHSSSQYNRLKLQVRSYPELKKDIAWTEVARTDGFGSIHLSSATVEALRMISEEHHGMRRINSRFGEGTNPRMRQIREGLEALGIPSDSVLEHATKRILYGYRLDGAGHEIPLMFTSSNFSRSNVKQITSAWTKRWLIKRIKKDDILERVSSSGPTTIKDILSCSNDGQIRLQLESSKPLSKESLP